MHRYLAPHSRPVVIPAAAVAHHTPRRARHTLGNTTRARRSLADTKIRVSIHHRRTNPRRRAMEGLEALLVAMGLQDGKRLGGSHSLQHRKVAFYWHTGCSKV